MSNRGWRQRLQLKRPEKRMSTHTNAFTFHRLSSCRYSRISLI